MSGFITEFNKIAKNHPNKIAIKEKEQTLTYKELQNKSYSLSRELSSLGLGLGDRVAIDLVKSTNYVVAILAVWYLGASFIPLDKKTPFRRKEYILKNSEVALIITDKKLFDYLSYVITNINISEFEEKRLNINENEAYIIYTSGSTGKPKGVIINHEGIVPMLKAQIAGFGVSVDSNVLWYVSPAFDASISDIGVTLLSGATLIINNEVNNSISDLVNIVKNEAVSYIDIPPSLLRLIPVGDWDDSLKTIVIGGEAPSPNMINDYVGRFDLFNVYGPTEATVCTSFKKCHVNWSKNDIGSPIKGVSYQVFDNKTNRFIAEGIGELVIVGKGISSGYVNEPKLNKEKFRVIEGETMFFTGDIVEKKGNGYYFVGRNDRQIKINGKLVSLDEIQQVLNDHPEVERAAVFYKKIKKNSKDRLVAYVKLKQGNSESIDNYLSERIPDWMIPHRIEYVEKIAVGESGKISYKQLKNNKNIPDLLEAIVEIVIGESIGNQDNFFEAGLDSLGVFEFVNLAYKVGLNISVTQLYAFPTVSSLAKNIQTESSYKSMKEIIDKLNLLDGLKPSKVENKGMFNLLTGASGFLGIRILEVLSNQAEKVICLVRSVDDKKAMERLVGLVKNNGLTVDFEKIQVYCADISQKQLGLKDSEYNFLVNNVKRVFHCASDNNLSHDFNQLWDTNVIGVYEIIKLCILSGASLRHVSTLSVFTHSDFKDKEVIPKSPYGINRIFGAYAQTKLAAEVLIQKYAEELGGSIVYRPSLLVAHGINESNNQLYRLLKVLKHSNHLPNDDSKRLAMNLVDVDKVVKEMVLEAPPNKGVEIIHLSDKRNMGLNELVECIKDDREISDYFNWVESLYNNNEIASLNKLELLYSSEEVNEYKYLNLFEAYDKDFLPNKDYSVNKKTIKEIYDNI